MSEPTPAQELPAVTHPAPDFAEQIARHKCATLLKAAQEPARVAEHNRLAGRIVGPSGNSPMQKIDTLSMLAFMVSQLLESNAIILNELLLLRTGKGELRQVKDESRNESINGKGQG